MLDNAELEIAPAEILVVTGPSGSGKSILIDVVLGLGARRGSALEIGVHSRSSAAPIRIGAVFQSPALFGDRTGEENLELACSLYGTDTDLQTLQEILGRLGLNHRTHTQVSDLSGGERLRVGIARALASGAELLVFDEPTNGLDLPRIEALGHLLRDTVRERGRSVLIVSHDVDFICEVADRILVVVPEDARLRPLNVAIGTDRRSIVRRALTPSSPPECDRGGEAQEPVQFQEPYALVHVAEDLATFARLGLASWRAITLPTFGDEWTRGMHAVSVAPLGYTITVAALVGLTLVANLLQGGSLPSELLDEAVFQKFGPLVIIATGPLVTSLVLLNHAGTRMAALTGQRRLSRLLDWLRTVGVREAEFVLFPLMMSFIPSGLLLLGLYYAVVAASAGVVYTSMSSISQSD